MSDRHRKQCHHGSRATDHIIIPHQAGFGSPSHLHLICASLPMLKRNKSKTEMCTCKKKKEEEDKRGKLSSQMERRQGKCTESDFKTCLKNPVRDCQKQRWHPREMYHCQSPVPPISAAANLCGPRLLPPGDLFRTTSDQNKSQPTTGSLSSPSITRNQTVYFSNKIFPG